MVKTLHTEIEIAASAEVVWQVLTDFAAYPSWNPFVRRISGAQQVGARLEIELQPPGGRTMRFRPVVRAFEPNRELRWLGRVGVPGLFDGEHRFAIELLAPERVRFIQEERFSGVLVRLLSGSLDGATRAGFVAMNEALRQRVEGSNPRASASGGPRP